MSAEEIRALGGKTRRKTRRGPGVNRDEIGLEGGVMGGVGVGRGDEVNRVQMRRIRWRVVGTGDERWCEG